MKKAYIAVPYQGRSRFQEELETIIKTLRQYGVNPFVFADQYTFKSVEERQMMQQAMVEINQSDWLIAFASEKAIGIGIEAGYAKGKGKPVIYIRQSESEHSTTLSGISDYQIIYTDLTYLAERLERIFQKLHT